MQIHGLPIDCRSTSGLSKIASQVDTPLFTDKFTKNRERVNYARVLVEVDITQPPPHTMGITLPDGQDVELELRYESTLKLCSVCRQIGHYQTHCPIVVATAMGGRQEPPAVVPGHSRKSTRPFERCTNVEASV